MNGNQEVQPLNNGLFGIWSLVYWEIDMRWVGLGNMMLSQQGEEPCEHVSTGTLL